jgi:hypothetical protein
MSIMHASSTVVAKSKVPDAGWTPTILGRIAADGSVVYSNAIDTELVPTSASSTATTAVWLIKTSSGCYIRTGGYAVGGSGGTNTRWFNGAGDSQGDPGVHTSTGTDIFILGTIPDTVNIYNKVDTDVNPTTDFSNVSGVYTSNDKSTFFNPSQDVKYGRQAYCAASQTIFGSDTEEGTFEIQFTFRKSGETDYTVTFKSHSKAIAIVDA